MTEPIPDPLDAFLRDAAPGDPPEDLVARILAATGDASARKELYWADVGQAARAALFASAAALLISAGLAGLALGEATPAPAQAVAEFDVSDDSLESQMASSFMLLGEDR